MSSVLTVSQLNRYLAFKLRSDMKLKGVALKGELSNFVVNSRSGHAYFSVKDECSVIKGVMFASTAAKLKFIPENGMNVLVVGEVSVYERDGIFQIVASEISPMGAGAVKIGLDQLKQKLQEKGVFDASSKKKIPILPKKIAVVTSLTGDALQDIRSILERRCPIVRLEVFPAQVQGSDAPDSIVKALSRADKSGADTIILARGGGSDEDLMTFNSEKIALAVYECKTPLISAVGHEADVSFTDLAADLRASTPSAAAELAAPVISQLAAAVDLMQQRLNDTLLKRVSQYDKQLSEIETRLMLSSPSAAVMNEEKKLGTLSLRLENFIKKRLDRETMLVDRFAAQLSALSPFNILDRGYSLTFKNDRPANAADLASGDNITVLFSDGSAEAEIKQVNRNDI